MVILFSGRKEKTEKEIIDILTDFGANYISDKKISAASGGFTIISEYKKTDIKIDSGIAVMLDNSERFENQIFPEGIIGICESSNLKALEILRANNTPVISCGMNPKSSVTLSSLNSSSILLTVQRRINLPDKIIQPGEYQIEISKKYSPFSIMASAVILFLKSDKSY